jgi:hypothetical protein
MMRRDGRRHPGRAGANDQHVAGDGLHLFSLPRAQFLFVGWVERSEPIIFAE